MRITILCWQILVFPGGTPMSALCEHLDSWVATSTRHLNTYCQVDSLSMLTSFLTRLFYINY
ncbi:hypothetical protein Hanom_Chr16g01415751 [Helianthus anomalus]